MIFFFKQKTAYEMRISDWSSDVCSSDLGQVEAASAHLTIHIEGVPAMAEEEAPAAIPATSQEVAVPPVAATPIVVTPNDARITLQRLSQVPPPPMQIGRAHV